MPNKYIRYEISHRTEHGRIALPSSLVPAGILSVIQKTGERKGRIVLNQKDLRYWCVQWAKQHADFDVDFPIARMLQTIFEQQLGDALGQYGMHLGMQGALSQSMMAALRKNKAGQYRLRSLKHRACSLRRQAIEQGTEQHVVARYVFRACFSSNNAHDSDLHCQIQLTVRLATRDNGQMHARLWAITISHKETMSQDQLQFLNDYAKKFAKITAKNALTLPTLTADTAANATMRANCIAYIKAKARAFPTQFRFSDTPAIWRTQVLPVVVPLGVCVGLLLLISLSLSFSAFGWFLGAGVGLVVGIFVFKKMSLDACNGQSNGQDDGRLFDQYLHQNIAHSLLDTPRQPNMPVLLVDDTAINGDKDEDEDEDSTLQYYS